jgi:hypothetical protein
MNREKAIDERLEMYSIDLRKCNFEQIAVPCLKRWMRLGSIERVRAAQINQPDVSCDLDRLPPPHVAGRGRQAAALQR